MKELSKMGLEEDKDKEEETIPDQFNKEDELLNMNTNNNILIEVEINVNKTLEDKMIEEIEHQRETDIQVMKNIDCICPHKTI